MSESHRRAERVALSLLLGLVALIGLASIRSWDLWWHLATGRLALEQGSTLPLDVFSLTRAGEPWVYKDLGAEVVLWLLYDAAGVAGLVLFKLSAALGLGALLMLSARRRAPAVWLVLALAGTALVVASFRVAARPEAFTLVGLPALLLLLDRWRRQPAPRGPGSPLAIVLLVGLWANLHRGVVLGVAVLLGYAVYELASALERRLARPGRWLPSVVTPADRPLRESGKSLVLALAAGAATLLNPSGTALWLQSLAVGTSETLAGAVSEWARLSPGELLNEFPFAVGWAVAVASAVPLSWWRSRRGGGDVDLWDVGLAALGLWAGLSAVRLLPIMVILTIGPLAGALTSLVPDRRDRAAPAVLPMALAVVLVVGAGLADGRIGRSAPGLARDWYPEQAVALIGEAPVLGQGFTTFTFAGYVLFHLWPDKRVPCDGRFDTVYDDDTMLACLAAQHTPERFQVWVDELDLQWVLAHNRPTEGRGFAWLDRDPRWVLVHWDAASLLYVRRSGANAGLARRLGFGLLRPNDVDVSLMEALAATRRSPLRRAQLDAEVRRLQEAAADDYRTFVVTALYLHGVGATDSEAYRLVVEGLRVRRDEDPVSIDQVLKWIGER